MKFWTNRIPTNSSGDFSKLIEKIAASRQGQVKTAAIKEAVATEPANDENEMRTNVHGVEGSPGDQNGEPEADCEQKVVEPKSLTSNAAGEKKEAQLSAPARPAPIAQPQAPKPIGVQQKPSAPMSQKPSIAPKPMAPASPLAQKPANPLQNNPNVHPQPTLNPIPNSQNNPAAGIKPVAPLAGANPAATASPLGAKPAVAPVSGQKPSPVGGQKPPVAPVAGQNAAPAAPRPQTAAPSLATAAGATKVADAPALGKGEGDGENEEGVTKGRFPEPDREQMYKQEPQEDGKAETTKESATQVKDRFIRIANLTSKSKSWLKRYWNILYPESYADAMTQDK